MFISLWKPTHTNSSNPSREHDLRWSGSSCRNCNSASFPADTAGEGRPAFPAKPDFGYARTARKFAPVLFYFFSLALLKKMAFHTDSYNWSWVSILSSLVLIKQLNPDWLPCGGLCLTSCVRSGETNRRINILFLRQCGMLDPQTIPITLSPSAKMDQRNDLISIRR